MALLTPPVATEITKTVSAAKHTKFTKIESRESPFDRPPKAAMRGTKPRHKSRGDNPRRVCDAVSAHALVGLLRRPTGRTALGALRVLCGWIVFVFFVVASGAARAQELPPEL